MKNQYDKHIDQLWESLPKNCPIHVGGRSIFDDIWSEPDPFAMATVDPTLKIQNSPLLASVTLGQANEFQLESLHSHIEWLMQNEPTDKLKIFLKDQLDCAKNRANPKKQLISLLSASLYLDATIFELLTDLKFNKRQFFFDRINEISEISKLYKLNPNEAKKSPHFDLFVSFKKELKTSNREYLLMLNTVEKIKEITKNGVISKINSSKKDTTNSITSTQKMMRQYCQKNDPENFPDSMSPSQWRELFKSLSLHIPVPGAKGGRPRSRKSRKSK